MAIDKLSRLWSEHQNDHFPAGCAGTDIEGVDLVLLDEYVAGCISTAAGSSDRLDGERLKILSDCRKNILKVNPKLPETAKSYFERLLQMTELALTENGWKP